MVMKRLVVGGAMLALGLSFVSAAHGQMRGDKAVYFTFSAPVTVPNTTLPAGRYLFRLADSLVNRQIVQIYSADGSKLHAMLMTLPQIRLKPSDNAEVRFLETPANQAPALATWWYPGERTGWEFIYPREQAQKLAQASKSNVLTTAQNNTSTDMRSGDLVRVSPTGEQTPAAADAEVPAFDDSDPMTRGEMAANAPDLTPRTSATAPATSVAQSTQSPTAAPSSMAAQPMQTTRSELPATASFVPAAALAGAVAFLTAFAMRIRRSRRA